MWKFEREEKESVFRFHGVTVAYVRDNMEAPWQVLIIYGIRGRILNGIKYMYVDS